MIVLNSCAENLFHNDNNSNFIPNYKDLATLAQIFNDEMTVKRRVMLEKQVLKNMISKEEKSKEEMKPIDKLTFKTFINLAFTFEMGDFWWILK